MGKTKLIPGPSRSTSIIGPRVFGGAKAFFSTITGPAFDSAAQAFFTAASITDATQKNAINRLVLDLKSYGVWDLMSAIYPFVGGSASSHSVNLKNPGTFDITWAGGVTHDSNGVTGNGTNAFGTTGYTPSTHGTLNSEHISFYCRTNSTASSYEMGCVATSRTTLDCRDTDNNCFFSSQAGGDTSQSVSRSDSLFIVNRTASNAINLWRAGVKQAQLTTASTSRPAAPIAVLARGASGSPSGYSAKNGAFASIGLSLTDTQAENLYTAVQAFQTTLGRQV